LIPAQATEAINPPRVLCASGKRAGHEDTAKKNELAPPHCLPQSS
jgi:hypothetical protein